MKLKIDPDFKNLIPPLRTEEFEQLELNILSEKRCREAILIWRGFIVDGYNRYFICSKHKIPFEVTKLHFISKEDALIWIAENQLGRRNLSDAVRIDIATRRAELLKAKKPIKVRKTIAEAAGVSEQTVQRYVKIIESADADTIKKLRCGEIKIGTAFKKITAQSKVIKDIYVGSKGYIGVVSKIEGVGGVYWGVDDAERNAKLGYIDTCLNRQVRGVEMCLLGYHYGLYGLI